MAKTNPRLKRALLDVVNNQLRAGTPPETAETFARLQAEGYSAQEAKELIACVVTSEIFDMMKFTQVYDEARYVKALKALPKMPWD
jgi:hypothetical protein